MRVKRTAERFDMKKGYLTRVGAKATSERTTLVLINYLPRGAYGRCSRHKNILENHKR